MNNQDTVAAILTRPDLQEMHHLVYNYGNTKELITKSWGMIVKLQTTNEFLIKHNWSLNEYSTRCSDEIGFQLHQAGFEKHGYMKLCFARLANRGLRLIND